MSALVGASLSLSGLLFQGVFRNPLVEPYILGISSGAACGAAFAIVFGILSIEVSSFIFSILAMATAYFITDLLKARWTRLTMLYGNSKTNRIPEG